MTDDYSGIMSRRDKIRSVFLCKLKKSAELYVLIAHDVGVGHSPRTILAYHVVNDFFFIFLLEVECKERDIERRRRPHRITPLFAPIAGQKISLPDLDKNARHVVAVFFEQRRGYRTVYPSR